MNPKQSGLHCQPVNRRKTRQKGAALLLFAVTVPFLLAMLGFALDVAWAHYTAKKAQAATDAAVLAAVTAALEEAGPGGTVNCDTAGCQDAGACPDSGNLQKGCEYSRVNGFVQYGERNTQSVTIAAGDSTRAPGLPDIHVDYWVQSVVQQRIPPWFSGIISNTGLSPTIRSTAAVRSQDLSDNIYLLNRSSDCFVSALNIGLVCGENFLALGFNELRAERGIYMASSNGAGLGLPAIAAGTIAAGGVRVEAQFTRLLGNGGIQNILAATSWTSTPQNGFTEASMFSDPMAGKGQPPAPAGLVNRPVPGGIIAGSLLGGPVVLPPGNYYATAPALNTPTGLPITVVGNVIFSDGSGSQPCGGFCDYVFYGGLVTAPLSRVTFAPGRYVFAGAQPVAGGPGIGLTVGANSVVTDFTGLQSDGEIGPNSDAGEIFIFTDKNYPGLSVPAVLSGMSFPQVRAGVSAGLNPRVTLHGLNKDHPAVPAELRKFAPALIWQDQANTTLKYTPDGRLDTSCGGICSNILSVPGSQQLIIQGSRNGSHAGVNLFGLIYSPRGSWTTILGLLPGDTVAGPLQLITGALQMTLNASLDLRAPVRSPKRLVASLIQ